MGDGFPISRFQLLPSWLQLMSEEGKEEEKIQPNRMTDSTPAPSRIFTIPVTNQTECI